MEAGRPKNLKRVREAGPLKSQMGRSEALLVMFCSSVSWDMLLGVRGEIWSCHANHPCFPASQWHLLELSLPVNTGMQLRELRRQVTVPRQRPCPQQDNEMCSQMKCSEFHTYTNFTHSVRSWPATGQKEAHLGQHSSGRSGADRVLPRPLKTWPHWRAEPGPSCHTLDFAQLASKTEASWNAKKVP